MLEAGCAVHEYRNMGLARVSDPRVDNHGILVKN
jgi:hypothetical protein